MKPIPQFLLEKINSYCDVDINSESIIKSHNISALINIKGDRFDYIINLQKVNDIIRVNKFHELVNQKIRMGGIYLSCCETLEERRKRVKNKIIFGFKHIFLFVDFIYKRVFPKISFIKHFYFFLTDGQNRVISKYENLGRLISCGFEIMEYFEYKNRMYVISKKVAEPTYDINASYGPLFRMRRVGYKGKIISVYKIRTMYPYSEYCQKLVSESNNLDDSGKFFNDGRITFWGSVLRKFWIDEIPMVINLLKGEVNLVGVRPLTKHYFSKYPLDLQNLRVRVKPGLIPPYYADLPKNFEEILLSERNYINSKLEKPYTTDIKYFFKSLYNIIIKRARSK